MIRTEPRRVARAPLTLNPVQQQIIYRTIVQREVVQAPQPQMVVVREPRTTWVPSPLPPFSYPVTTYEDRVAHVRPAYQAVVDDEDDTPVVRAAYTPATCVVGAQLPQTVRLMEMPQSVTLRVPATQPSSYATLNDRVLVVDPETRVVMANVSRY